MMDFDTWFDLRYGPRLALKEYEHLDDEALDRRVVELQFMEAEQRYRRRYDEMKWAARAAYERGLEADEQIQRSN